MPQSHYWDAASLHVDYIRMPQLADNPQVLAALADGTLDWATSFIPDLDNTFVAGSGAQPHLVPAVTSLRRRSRSTSDPDENNKKASTTSTSVAPSAC